MTLVSNRSLRSPARGSALLAVLWLTAALSAVAFSVASTVRGETERVATGEEDVRASYLAKAAIQRAILYIQWGQLPQPDTGAPFYITGQSRFAFRFPTGEATVEIIPESGKVSLNYASPELLQSLLISLGEPPDQAGMTAAAIIEWRSPVPNQGASLFDQLYLSRAPSFQAPHASFHDVEELLNIPGINPDFFYGTWKMQGGKLTPSAALRDCVSVFGGIDHFDANTVQPAVLAAVGVPPDQIQMLLNRRNQAPFLTQQDVTDLFGGASVAGDHVGVGYHTLLTLRATARVRRGDGVLSDLKRTAAALVKILPPASSESSFHILRWYDRS